MSDEALRLAQLLRSVCHDGDDGAYFGDDEWPWDGLKCRDLMAAAASLDALLAEKERLTKNHAEIVLAIMEAGIPGFGYATEAIKQLGLDRKAAESEAERLRRELEELKGKYENTK